MFIPRSAKSIVFFIVEVLLGGKIPRRMKRKAKWVNICVTLTFIISIGLNFVMVKSVYEVKEENADLERRNLIARTNNDELLRARDALRETIVDLKDANNILKVHNKSLLDANSNMLVLLKKDTPTELELAMVEQEHNEALLVNSTIEKEVEKVNRREDQLETIIEEKTGITN